MKQAASSRRAGRSRVAFSVLKEARGGDIEAMTLIQRHFEPYIRRLATISVCGTSYVNVDLYDRLKTRLIVETLKFEF